jgi:hypothetical protein
MALEHGSHLLFHYLNSLSSPKNAMISEGHSDSVSGHVYFDKAIAGFQRWRLGRLL